jgi:competence protein ComEC
MSFTETKMYKKGNAGENIIRSMIVEKGWITYSPDQHDKAHYFDMLATKDKKQIIALDVKTKAIIDALLLGQRVAIDKATITDYSNAGVIHILAISGFISTAVISCLPVESQCLRFPPIPA